MAVLEAMANGVPVIASNVGGLPDLIESKKNGLLVPAGDSSALVDAICSLYEDVDLRYKISDESKDTIQSKYGIANWISEIEELYLDLTKKVHRK